MPTLFLVIRRCAVCGLEEMDARGWLAAVVTCDRIALRHANEMEEDCSSELHFCCESHAMKFMNAWLFCEATPEGNRHDRFVALPRTDEFRLSCRDAAIEVSLCTALEAFWEEGIQNSRLGALGNA